jgi:hypothetical protein
LRDSIRGICPFRGVRILAATLEEEIFQREISREKNNAFSIAGIFPYYSEDWYLNAIAELCYKQHGGSGFNFNFSDVERFDLNQIEYFLNWLDDRRTEEARRIEKASKTKVK